MATGTGSQPCGACRFLRRKCSPDCVFAPYFCSEDGPASFAAIHKVFGASNVSKLLYELPDAARRDAIITVAFEAQSRIKDPVYGCVSHVIDLQQQMIPILLLFGRSLLNERDVNEVDYLQDQVMQMEAYVARNLIDDHQFSENHHQWPNNDTGIGSSPFSTFPNHITYPNSSPSQGLFKSINDVRTEIWKPDEQVSFQNYIKKIPSHTELSELQELALRMMKKNNS